MRRRTMQRHPWNINHTPSLVLCDFIFPHHAPPGLNVLVCSLKCLFLLVVLHIHLSKMNWIQVRCTKRVALKAAVYSISFCQLFNAFGEISAHLTNASLNLLDRCWWNKLVLGLYSSPAEKAKHLWMLLPLIHTHMFPTSKHTQHMSTHTNKSSTLITSALSQYISSSVFPSDCSEISHRGVSIIRRLSASKRLMLYLHVTVIIFLVYVWCLNF